MFGWNNAHLSPQKWVKMTLLNETQGNPVQKFCSILIGKCYGDWAEKTLG